MEVSQLRMQSTLIPSHTKIYTKNKEIRKYPTLKNVLCMRAKIQKQRKSLSDHLISTLIPCFCNIFKLWKIYEWPWHFLHFNYLLYNSLCMSRIYIFILFFYMSHNLLILTWIWRFKTHFKVKSSSIVISLSFLFL